MRLWPWVLCFGVATGVGASPFTVVIYNVENLFDADEVAIYDDYQADRYTPAHFATKLENIAEIVAVFDGGRGPDVILFQEIELDQTPAEEPTDFEAVLAKLAGKAAREWLEDPALDGARRTLPAEAWLLKALADRGMTGYHVVPGGERAGQRGDGGGRAIHCVTFSRFPVTRVASHPSLNARNLLETELDVGGHPLIVFNLHWRSGAGNATTEEIRIQSAEMLRARLDEIFAQDRNADVILGGDFNSHYDQSQRYRETMKRTAVNTVLGSQGNELALRGRERDLYNLWFELPPEQRGSDTFQGEWGTLMHIMVSRGLYDRRGVQYQDNSFGVVRLPGLNVDAAGAPIRWNAAGERGMGYSDHLPIYAHFLTVEDNAPDRWIALQRPSETESDGFIRPVSYAAVDLSRAVRLADVPTRAELRDGSWSGKFFVVEGPSVEHQYPRVKFAGDEWEIYGTTREIRALLYAQRDERQAFRFVGELGTYRGRWQFVVRDVSWITAGME